MKNPFFALSLLKLSIKHCFSGPLNILLTMVPIIMGILFYIFIFAFLNDFIMSYTKPFLDKWLGPATTEQSTLVWIIFSLLAVFFYFFLNWTFVLIVSLFSAPFNEILSQRVANQIGIQQSTVILSFKQKVAWFFRFFWNEMKKILLIGFLTILALLLSYIPLLAIISILLGFLLVSIQFVSITWSREEIPALKTMTDLLRNAFAYMLSGAMFFLLINIPLANVIVPSLGTVYFTLLYYRLNPSDKVTVTN
jgi:uncharacterized protein involved in cysteine biosynthesis